MSSIVDMFVNRVKKNAKHLGKWAKRENVSCWRVYDRDIPEVPVTLAIASPAGDAEVRIVIGDHSEKRQQVRGVGLALLPPVGEGRQFREELVELRLRDAGLAAAIGERDATQRLQARTRRAESPRRTAARGLPRARTARSGRTASGRAAVRPRSRGRGTRR